MKRLVLLIVLTITLFGLKAQNPNCPYKYGATPEDSLLSLERITYFQTFYNQKNYKEAYQNWQYLVQNCPCSWDGIFAYSQTMFDNLIKEEGDDSTRKQILVDSLLWSYQARSLYFPEKFSEGSGLGFIALNTIRYRTPEFLSADDRKEFKNAYNLFVQSVELEKEKTQPSVWDIYFKVAIQMVKMQQDTTILIDAYERATSYIEIGMIETYKRIDKQVSNLENLQQRMDADLITPEEYNKTLALLQRDTARANLFINTYQRTLSNIEASFSPYAPCNVLIDVYSKRMPSIKDNIPALKKMLKLFQNAKDCPKINPVFVEGLEIVHRAEPSAFTAFLMGNYTLQKENLTDDDFNKALLFFHEADSLYETNNEKANIQFMIGNVYMIQQKYSESRNAANQAIKYNPNFAKAYILIGDLYAASGSRCSGGDALPNANSWAALDKYNKALSIDPSLTNDVNTRKSRLVYPTQNDKFVRGLNNGDSYRVGCWINESTTVR